MRVRAQRWGNSLAVRIPKSVAEEVGMRAQEEFEVAVEQGVIRLHRAAPEPSLEDLLAGITAENLHGEVDCGRPEGAEAW